MKKTIPVYLIQSITLASFLALSACTSQLPKPVAQQPKSVVKPVVNPVQATPAQVKEEIKPESLFSLTKDELEFQIEIAKREQDWGRYIQFNNQLWQISTEGGQAVIEQQIWDTLTSHSHEDTEEMLYTLSHHYAESVKQWALLLSIVKGPAKTLVQHLEVLADNQPDAIYTKHLLPGLIGEMSNFTTIQQIAILLPFEGKYKQVSQQIRNGILKAFFASEQNITLKFYDTSDLENFSEVWQNAKLDGAEFIIGPLTKEAVQLLADFEDPDVLALNSIEEAPFPQFNYKGSDEVAQMVRLFEQKNYQNIGILTNDSRSNLKTAHALQNAWQANQNHVAVISAYPNVKPKLRQALGELINENASKQRFQHIKRMTKDRLSFFPRTRQDFDAIVIIDNSQRIAVFQPQLAFFELDVPIYGSLQLSPKKLQNIKPNRDLKGVQFLTRPVTLNPENLSSNFEAFGWDSFQIVNHLNQLRLGGYLKSGKTGEITLEDNQLKQNLIWTKYNRRGVIKRWVEPKVDPVTEALAQMAAPNSTESNEQPAKVTIQNVYIPEARIEEAPIQSSSPYSLF